MKNWYKSWTINFGLLLQIAAVIQLNIAEMGNPYATMAVGVVVVLLRFKTTKPVSEK